MPFSENEPFGKQSRGGPKGKNCSRFGCRCCLIEVENIAMPQLAPYGGRNPSEIRNTINRSCVRGGGENIAGT